MKWTEEQELVFSVIEHDTSHMVIDAVAGSGKTSTIVEAMKRAKGRSIFLAFNASIAAELRKRGCEASTLHSLGLRSLRGLGRVDVDERSKVMWEHLRNKIAPEGLGAAARKKAVSAAGKLVSAILAGMVTVEECEGGVDLLSEVTEDGSLIYDLGLSGCLAVVRAATSYVRMFDEWNGDIPITFDLMLYLPVRFIEQGVMPPRKLTGDASTVFVDEAQDLNPIQHQMISIMARAGRIVAVGDRGQAIYGFRGAYYDSLDRLKKTLKGPHRRVVECKLSRCFRCPESHIVLASVWRPGIECGTDRPGKTESGSTGMMSVVNTPNVDTLVISRTRKAAMKAALGLIRSGIKFRSPMRNIVSGAVELLKKFGDGVPADDAIAKMQASLAMMSESAAGEDSEAKGKFISTMLDNIEVVSAILQALRMTNVASGQGDGTETVGEVLAHVDTLINNTSAPAHITVSTIHSAKGLEADRVYLQEYTRMPMTWPGQTDEEYRQEVNILYVGLTRSKDWLYLDDGRHL